MRVASSLVLVIATLGCGGSATSPSETGTATPPPIVVALGDSLTAGPGLERDQTFPAALQRRAAAAGYRHRIINAGVSGDTSSDILRRFDRDVVPETRVLILAAGANDGLQGVAVSTVRANVRTMLERARQRGIRVLVCGMDAPPVRGLSYSLDFHRVFPDLAEEFGVPLMPFLLIGVLGLPDYNLGDGVHPNARGAERIADNMWPYLEPLLKATLDTGWGIAPVIRVLAAFLFAWEPLRVARELTMTLGSFEMRGAVAIVEVLAHGAVAALAVAAAQALWNRNPLGPRLAAVALVGSVLADVQSLYWSVLPSQTIPADRAPLAIVAIANGAAWLGYLTWAGRRPTSSSSTSTSPWS